ncbi:MAG: nuclear transport factor 2 family protein [Hydrogenophaga sp.]|jgi:hypothetical protein|uniref:nuclear transport factor 2 family protein n=1 Tax=Hydrogenophaga sp. TaxID=1904254 RepID=UPI00263256F2|nr:nuclear transport factor 2 family protein [Hydrogenophaga sp.]MCW5669094.1 nuclear transport factor 2 family protein [Hydrogenophaga sp.]
MNELERARRLIGRFIQAVNDRDAPRAQACLAPGARLIFPGPTVFHEVADFLAWSGPRYESVLYTYGPMERAERTDATVVYAQGVVSGVFADGVVFEGVRYVDRFEIVEDLIVSKEVWSDMGDRLRKLGR